MKVVITIPAYNEEETIGKVIEDINKIMGKFDYEYKVLVVNDGSKDNTAQISKKNGAMVYSHDRNLGLAETFRTEMIKCLELGADVIVHTDADGQYKAEEIPMLLEEIKKGNDLVLGSRFKGKIESMPLIKRLGNISFSKVLSQISGYKISDGQTGFRAFTKDVAKLDIKSDHTYTQEQILRAAKNRFKIKEIPIHFIKRLSGKSRLMKNPFEYAIKAWISILRIYRDYEPLKFFGLFGGSFFLVGFLIGLEVFYRFITTGSVGTLPRVMLSVLFISIGVQIILFGFLADMKK
jgi:glycosyltransferase involved in cell wall biosynthesis